MANPTPNPTTISAGTQAAWEYLNSYGDLTGYNWSAAGYATPDAGAAAHWNANAVTEGRSITFDAWEYMASNADISTYFVTDATGAAMHYFYTGRLESRPAWDSFDGAAYLAANADVATWASLDGAANDEHQAAYHYVLAGRSEILSGARASDGQGTVSTIANIIQLTNGVDIDPGPPTAGVDHFYADNTELNPNDQIAGLGGNDVFYYATTADATHGGFFMNNVERFDIVADNSSTATFDFSGTTDVDTFAVRNTTGNANLNQITELFDPAAVADGGDGKSTTLEVNTMTTGGNVIAQFQDQAVAGATDQLDLDLINNYNTGIGLLRIGSVTDNDGGIETLNVTTSSAGTRIQTLDADVTTLNVTGDQDLTVIDPLDDEIATVGATSMTGDLTLDMSETDVDVDYNGSQGKDTVTFDDAPGTTTNTGLDHDIDGGAGSDDITGGDGDDGIDGGAGDDEIDGREGADDITGGAGEDDITGAGGVDDIDGGADDDTIDGGAGADNITGGTGEDEITGGEGTDEIIGGPGADIIDLAETTQVVDEVIYNSEADAGTVGVLNPNQGDEIRNFETGTDDLEFTGDFDGSDLVGAQFDAVTAVAYGGVVNLDTNGVGDNAVFLVASGAATVDVGDLTTLVDLQAAITFTNENAGDQRILIFNDDPAAGVATANSAIYLWESVTEDNAISDGELSLLGIVTASSTGGVATSLTAADIVVS